MLAFRRPECPVFGLAVRLGGVQPDATYQVEFIDESRQQTTRTMTGRELSSELPLEIPTRPGSLVVCYRPTSDQPGE